MGYQEITDQINKLRQEIVSTPYHKGTEHYIGRLRAKLARFEDQLLQRAVRRVAVMLCPRRDATVAWWAPSVGKSTLLNVLSKASSKVTTYPLRPQRCPRMFDFRAKIKF